jgi:hypothetical protein
MSRTQNWVFKFDFQRTGPGTEINSIYLVRTGIGGSS